MKNLIFTFLLLLLSLNLGAQTDSDSLYQRKNDIVVDPIMLIAIPAVNISYERLISKGSGIGVNALVSLQRDDESNFTQISPYYRMYFGKKYASGFFLEGFVPITTTKEDYTYITTSAPRDVKETATTVGIGFGVGGKWVVRKNLLIEVSGGIARRFTNKEYIEYLTGRFMGGIGYRF